MPALLDNTPLLSETLDYTFSNLSFTAVISHLTPAWISFTNRIQRWLE